METVFNAVPYGDEDGETLAVCITLKAGMAGIETEQAT